jgi:hypothetical protein
MKAVRAWVAAVIVTGCNAAVPTAPTLRTLLKPSWNAHRVLTLTRRALPLISTDHAEVGSPWAYLVCILSSQHARDLNHMVEIVRHPRGEQLA